MTLQRFSLLDLSPVPQGATTAAALRNTLDLAQSAEAAGYHRFWLAEHHNMPGIASAATAVLIGQVAARTATIRVGAGGVMLPNHAPLMVAEAFGTLAELYPGRIDLGLGRAPGTDMATMRALRRSMGGEDDFPADVQELQHYFSDADGPVRAIPGQGTGVPLWILGSSLYGAQLAAHLGLPYAFASHFAPDLLAEALHVYRSHFRPSAQLDAPYVMLAAGVCVADTDDHAALLRTSQELAFAALRTGRPGRLPEPVDDIAAHVPAPVLAQVRHALGFSAVGSPATVQARLDQMIAAHQPDELMVTGAIHDPAQRIYSFELAAGVLRDLCTAPTPA